MNIRRNGPPTASRPGKRLPPAFALGIILLILPAQGGERGATILRIYSWSEYFADAVLASFEERFDCHVAIDSFDSNEAMLSEMEKAGKGAYDIVTPSSYMTSLMRKRGMLEPMEHALIPNLKNLDPGFLRFTDDPELLFAVPYARTVAGVGFNSRRLPEFDRSWDIFGQSQLAGRATMLDDMRETIGAALKHLGYSLNTTDPEQLLLAGELLRKWRKNLAKFEVDEGNLGLASGEYLAVHGYNGDVAVVMEENGEIDFFVPREGSAITLDDFVIPAGTRNRELAHAFINHLLDVENAAANMSEVMYYMPIPEAIETLDPALRENRAFVVPDEVMEKCELIRNLDGDTALYEKIWEAVREK